MTLSLFYSLTRFDLEKVFYLYMSLFNFLFKYFFFLTWSFLAMKYRAIQKVRELRQAFWFVHGLCAVNRFLHFPGKKKGSFLGAEVGAKFERWTVKYWPRERWMPFVCGCERQCVLLWTFVVIKLLVTWYNSSWTVHHKLRRNLALENARKRKKEEHVSRLRYPITALQLQAWSSRWCSKDKGAAAALGLTQAVSVVPEIIALCTYNQASMTADIIEIYCSRGKVSVVRDT